MAHSETAKSTKIELKRAVPSNSVSLLAPTASMPKGSTDLAYEGADELGLEDVPQRTPVEEA